MQIKGRESGDRSARRAGWRKWVQEAKNCGERISQRRGVQSTLRRKIRRQQQRTACLAKEVRALRGALNTIILHKAAAEEQVCQRLSQIDSLHTSISVQGSLLSASLQRPHPMCIYATSIQAAGRGWLVRRAQAKRSEAAGKIQAAFRNSGGFSIWLDLQKPSAEQLAAVSNPGRFSADQLAALAWPLEGS